MKTLYLSDLDGTLLRSNESLSDYTVSTINRFVRDGGCFSYATARSHPSALRATAGLVIAFPMICHNGAFIIDSAGHGIIQSNYIEPTSIAYIVQLLAARNIFPIIFSMIDGKERFSFIERYATPAMKHFLDNRIGDLRRRAVSEIGELYAGDIFNISCADTEDSLSAIHDIISEDARYNCIYGIDIYSGAQWCEIISNKASKANAAMQLKTLLDCGKLVVFGDNRNDLSLFSIADECYAVENAVPELKEIATAVIGANDSDGVAKWISENAFK